MLPCIAVITGNLEIGNGYGVPGGGAYQVGTRSNSTLPSKTYCSTQTIYSILSVNLVLKALLLYMMPWEFRSWNQ